MNDSDSGPPSSQRTGVLSGNYEAEILKIFYQCYENNFCDNILHYYLPAENVQQFDRVETNEAATLAGEVVEIHFDFPIR
jgi:hypothetical protein